MIEKVDTEAALINLDQSKAFDRVDHRYLGAVLSAAGFGPQFCSWVHLLYANPAVMVEVNGKRSRPFSLSRSIRQGCPLSPMLYVLAIEPFLRKLRVNPVLRGITLPGADAQVKYSAYADDVTVLVTSNAEISVVGAEIRLYETVTGAKINCDKSSGLRIGAWRGMPLQGPFSWSDGPCKILGVWFGPDLQLEKNWSEVLKAVRSAAALWISRNLSLKGRAEVCNSHIYPIFIYRLSVLPIPSDTLLYLQRALFNFLWLGRAPMVCRDVCYLHPSEGGLGMPNVEIRLHTLRLYYLDRMCTQDRETGGLWMEDTRKAFPALRGVHDSEGEAHRLPRGECPFYRECRRALKFLLRVKESLSSALLLSRKALYRVLVRGSVRDVIGEGLPLTKEQLRSIWPWAPGSGCLTNDEASLTWLVIRDALWVGRRLHSAGLATSPICKRCGDEVETLCHAFVYCRIVVPLIEFVTGLMVRILNISSLTLVPINVCSNWAPTTDRIKKELVLTLLAVMRCVIWSTRMRVVYGSEDFAPSDLIRIFRHHLKNRIKAERVRLSSSDFFERWVSVARVCRVREASLDWFLDVP